MAAVYNAEGIFMYDDGQPSIDQMQYELARNGKSSPLDSAVNAIKNVAINNNPLMLRKQGLDLAGDIPRVMASGVAPYIAGITQPVVGAYQYASKMPGVLYRENVLGDPQSMQEAATIREGLPQFAPPGARYNPAPMNQRIEAIGQAVAPQTPQGQAVLEGATQVFEPLKLPMIGPGSGLPGTSRISPRPMFTPNDLRVVGAEATRVGRQIGDIPTDFANAQSGLQRIDPVTGQPVIGARIQSGVDRLGDIMEQRKMQGLTPIPGLPAALQPETSMYAVRPQGSRLTTPVVPETARGFSPPIDPANDMFKEVVGLDPERAEVTPTLLHSLNSRVQFNNVPNDRDAINGFRSFMQNKAQEMYPEAETPRQALEIFNAMHYDTPSRHAVENKMFDEFIQTPEGQQLLPNAVSTDEMAKRHDAATEGLKNMWGKYLVKNLGTEGNPAVKMAAQEGLTYLPAEDVLDRAQNEKGTAQSHRRNAGISIEGSFASDINALHNEITALNLPIRNAANAEQSLSDQLRIAKQLAEKDSSMQSQVVDIGSAYKEAKKIASNLTRQKADLQKKLDKLTLADAYETLEDASVAPIDAKTLLEKMPYAEQQFYPELKESAKRGEMAYKAYDKRVKGTGIVDAAQQFYDDVIAGNIPKDKARTLPVDRYLHEASKARVQNIQKYRNDVFNDIKSTASAIPKNKQFSGNVGVIELTQDTPEFVANKEAALSTEALDICIGEGGGGAGTRNFFTKKKDPTYTPIVDIKTGKPNPNASRHTTRWVQDIYRGGELPMFRDMETGMPIAALQFMKSSSVGVNGQPMFNIGYASGAGNGRIEAKYIDGIRDYLNTRADDIAGIGENLEKNAGIYDTRNRSSLNESRSSAQVSADQMKTVDWDSMPRFMTAKDIKQAVQGAVSAVTQQSAFNPADVAELQATLVDNIEFVIDNAIQSTGLPNPDGLERRLDATFSRMRREIFPTFLDDPVPTMNRALDYLRSQIDNHSNSATSMSQEIVEALDNYASELETARDDMINQQQRVQQPAPQAVQQAHQMQPIEEVRHLIDFQIVADPAVNDVLQSYSQNLQDYAANQARNGMSPVEIADGLRDTINRLRNIVLSQPTDFTRNFTPDQVGTYTSALRNTIDSIGQWLGEQNRPQTANLPAEVQQNIDRRNQHITNAYQTALTPNTGDASVDTALSEFSDLLDGMATNMFGNGYNASEIAENLADRVHAEHMALVTPDRIDARGLTPFEADMIRSRLNDAYGNLRTIREMGVPAPEPMVELNFEPDTMHGANEPYTMQSAVDMARDVFEQERIDTNNFDIPSIEQSIYALREGLFDDDRIRRLPENQRQSFSEDVAFRLQNMLDEMRGRQVQPVLPAPATAPYTPIPAIIHAMSDQAITADMTFLERNRVQNMFESLTDVNSPEELQNIVGLARSYAMGGWDDFSDVQREWLARNIEEYIGDNPPPNTPPPEEPPQRRGPFRPGGASAVRGVPLGNLNIQPSITAEAFRGPDRQPISNFLQQVKSMPGVTQEGLKTGLMAFENMDPSRQMTKAEFARELLPSSYDIVNLAGTATVDRHTMDMIESMIQDDPDASRDVFESMEGLTDIARKEIVDYLNDNPGGHFEWHMFSDKAKKSFAKSDGLIKDAASFLDQWANSQEHLKEQIYTEQYGQDINENGYKYEDVQRLTIPSMGDEYGEFGVTHPDQSGMYHHYDNAPEGTIGHFRGTYNPADSLELKTVTNETLTTKPGSYVIEEIQSDAQKGSAQKAHLHQVHGVLFKAAIQKALELGADTVYLPTAKIIASERPSVAGWEARPDDRGLTMQVPIRKDTTSKFAPIYDQAIVKEGLKPLLKIPGVTSKMVNGYHEISFTPEAKEHILNGPGQTIPGYKKGGQIRKYQDGGSTSDYGEPNNAALDAFDLMKLERWMSKRPEFRVDSKEFNDNTPDLERDDDAQVPRESTFDAKLKTPWEDDQWMQKNFNYRYRGKTFAKGGTVQPIPSVEQMKYELMKRS